MATNFSPCQGSYVLNQFPSIVMFDMKGFHISASGAIQGHHTPLITDYLTCWQAWRQAAQLAAPPPPLSIANPV